MKILQSLMGIYGSVQSKRLITRKIDGIENSNAIIFMEDEDEGLFKVIIPVEEMNIDKLEDKDSNKILRGMIGAEIDLLVKKIEDDENGNKIIYASRKEAMELRKRLEFSKHKVGEQILVRIISIGRNSVRAEAYGVETSIPIKEVEWGYISDIRKVVNVGDNVPAIITNIDKDTIELSLKQVKKDPFENIELRFKKGSQCRGVINNIYENGIFVDLTRGISTRCNFPNWSHFTANPGDVVLIRIKKVDKQKRRINSSLMRIVKKAE